VGSRRLPCHLLPGLRPPWRSGRPPIGRSRWVAPDDVREGDGIIFDLRERTVFPGLELALADVGRALLEADVVEPLTVAPPEEEHTKSGSPNPNEPQAPWRPPSRRYGLSDLHGRWTSFGMLHDIWRHDPLPCRNHPSIDRQGRQSSRTRPKNRHLTTSIRTISISGMDAESPYQVVCESRIVGEFHGYRAGNVYRLENGQVWHQESKKFEYAYREDPRCRILTDRISHHIDVEGTSTMARVVRRRQTLRRNAFPILATSGPICTPALHCLRLRGHGARWSGDPQRPSHAPRLLGSARSERTRGLPQISPVPIASKAASSGKPIVLCRAG
jgi:hypothetical protein